MRAADGVNLFIGVQPSRPVCTIICSRLLGRESFFFFLFFFFVFTLSFSAVLQRASSNNVPENGGGGRGGGRLSSAIFPQQHGSIAARSTAPRSVRDRTEYDISDLSLICPILLAVFTRKTDSIDSECCRSQKGRDLGASHSWIA